MDTWDIHFDIIHTNYTQESVNKHFIWNLCKEVEDGNINLKATQV